MSILIALVHAHQTARMDRALLASLERARGIGHGDLRRMRSAARDSENELREILTTLEVHLLELDHDRLGCRVCSGALTIPVAHEVDGTEKDTTDSPGESTLNEGAK